MSWLYADYLCVGGHRYEQLSPSPPSRSETCPRCGAASHLLVSAPHVKRFGVSVTRGESDDPPPGAFSTRHLARD